MENIQNIPDKKLHIGAKIGFITNIINIIWSIILAIILIASKNMIINLIKKNDPSTNAILSDVRTFYTVGIIIVNI